MGVEEVKSAVDFARLIDKKEEFGRLQVKGWAANRQNVD
jgi:hypothetical protein